MSINSREEQIDSAYDSMAGTPIKTETGLIIGQASTDNESYDKELPVFTDEVRWGEIESWGDSCEASSEALSNYFIFWNNTHRRHRNFLFDINPFAQTLT